MKSPFIGDGMLIKKADHQLNYKDRFIQFETVFCECIDTEQTFAKETLDENNLVRIEVAANETKTHH